jgi:glucokinase-like ROK family protein
LNHKIGQPELLKEINRSRAFEILKSIRILSRPELAQQTGLSRATIALLMEDLLRVGVAHHVGLGDSTGGRPPALLEFNPEAAYAVGAAMRDHEWRIVTTNLDAKVIERLDIPLRSFAPEDAVAALQEGITLLLDKVDRSKVLPALGLGTPGLVDMPSGVIKTAVDVGWFEVPIRELVERALGIPTMVANRSKVGALAEYWFGAKDGLHDLIYISIGTGVSAGIVHAGELYMGFNSSAGELGHVTILPDGPLCRCGNRGCLQQLVSEPAIADRARVRLRENGDTALASMAGNHPERVTAKMVFTAASQGDYLGLEVVRETARYLGIAIATLVNLFNPQRIILGGPVGQMSGVMLPMLLEEVRKRALSYPLSVAQIVPSALGADANAVGAAALVLRQASELIFADKN